MNKLGYFIITIIILFSCEASESLKGNWKALDINGEKFEIKIVSNNFSIADSTGKIMKYKFRQTGIKYENSLYTYSITLDDGRGYQIYFPKEDESVGLIKDENGKQMFTIGKKEYIRYDDIYKLY